MPKTFQEVKVGDRFKKMGIAPEGWRTYKVVAMSDDMLDAECIESPSRNHSEVGQIMLIRADEVQNLHWLVS